MNLIQASLQKILPGNRKTTSGGWVSFNAVCCHHRGESADKKKRGGVLFKEDGFVYSCFNCGFGAGWQPGKLFSKNTKDLFKWMGLPEDELNKLSLEAMREKDAIPVPEKLFTLELQEMPLPEDCLPIVDWIKEGCEEPKMVACIEYILGRNLTLDDYNWHWSAATGYKDRVIIPFFQDNKVVGWTGRKITEGNPRYLTHSQNGYVFNIDAQTFDKKFVIVVEGQFDAIASEGVAIMHNEPNAAQCFRINQLAREVIVVPDRDKAGAKMLQAAIDNGWSMSLPPWGDDIKDVAKAVEVYGRAYTLATILHYRESNKIKIELKKKELEKLNDKKQ
jgi:hypothetical protein